MAPSPALRARVMAAVGGGGAAAGGEAASSATVREGRPAPAAGAAAVPRSRRSAPAAGWLLPLAAGVALVSILVSGWLALRLAEQRTTIADLEAGWWSPVADADELAADRGEILARSDELAAQLGRVTMPGIDVCPLHPMPEAEGQAGGGAGALLYMSHGDGHWYLRIHGLPPPPEGTVYVLWFLGEGGSHTSGGVVSAADEAAAELSQGGLPAPGRMSRGVAVTVERTADVAQPAGPMVLFGAERMSLL